MQSGPNILKQRIVPMRKRSPRDQLQPDPERRYVPASNGSLWRILSTIARMSSWFVASKTSGLPLTGPATGSTVIRYR